MVLKNKNEVDYLMIICFHELLFFYKKLLTNINENGTKHSYECILIFGKDGDEIKILTRWVWVVMRSSSKMSMMQKLIKYVLGIQVWV